MKFQKGHDPRRHVGRKPGSKNKRTQLVEAVKEAYGSEENFWRGLCEMAKLGDSTAMRCIADRLLPTLKPESDSVELEPLEGTAVEVAVAVIQQAVTGQISTEQLTAIVGAIGHSIKITESTELEQRLAALEARKND